jgi:hypothetical protein
VRADNSAAIMAAACNRHELTRSTAIKTLRELADAGTPITFEAVARPAGVSRSWLYAQPDIRDQIQHLRETTRRAPDPAIPASQHASDASLLARLDAALQHNRKLSEQNQQLRRQLAHALGDQRAATLRRGPGQRSTSPSDNDLGCDVQVGKSGRAPSQTTSSTQTPRSVPRSIS